MAPVTCLWWRNMHALSVRAKLMLLYLLVTLAGLLIFGLMSFGALALAFSYLLLAAARDPERNVAIIDANRSAVGLVEAGDQAKRGGFTAA